MHSQLSDLRLSISDWLSAKWFLGEDFIPTKGTNQTHFTRNQGEFD